MSSSRVVMYSLIILSQPFIACLVATAWPYPGRSTFLKTVRGRNAERRRETRLTRRSHNKRREASRFTRGWAGGSKTKTKHTDASQHASSRETHEHEKRVCLPLGVYKRTHEAALKHQGEQRLTRARSAGVAGTARGRQRTNTKTLLVWS